MKTTGNNILDEEERLSEKLLYKYIHDHLNGPYCFVCDITVSSLFKMHVTFVNLQNPYALSARSIRCHRDTFWSQYTLITDERKIVRLKLIYSFDEEAVLKHIRDHIRIR